MALHAQQQVFNALQSLLAGGSTVAGARVFLDRADPLQASELPAILIEEDGGETVETVMLDASQHRETRASVACVLAATSTAPADARAFGLQVEKLVAGSSSLANLCRYAVVLAESQTVIHGEGDRLMATRHQTWRLGYLLNPLNPDVINP